MIVSPILVEVRKLKDRRISLFSGIDFSVDPDRGLSGFCDFILSLSPMQFFLESPVLAVVEAKNDNIKSGFGQCVAEMVGGQGLQRAEGGSALDSLWAGDHRQRLEIPEARWRCSFIDRMEYYLDRVDKVLGILLPASEGRCHDDCPTKDDGTERGATMIAAEIVGDATGMSVEGSRAVMGSSDRECREPRHSPIPANSDLDAVLRIAGTLSATPASSVEIDPVVYGDRCRADGDRSATKEPTT